MKWVIPLISGQSLDITALVSTPGNSDGGGLIRTAAAWITDGRTWSLIILMAPDEPRTLTTGIESTIPILKPNGGKKLQQLFKRVILP